MEPPLAPLSVNGTNGHHDGLLEPTTQFDFSLFRSYLSTLPPSVVGALPEELDDPFESGDFDETVAKPVAEGPDVIYVVKQRVDLEGSAFRDTFPLFMGGCVFPVLQHANFDVGFLPVVVDEGVSTFTYKLPRNSVTILRTPRLWL